MHTYTEKYKIITHAYKMYMHFMWTNVVQYSIFCTLEETSKSLILTCSQVYSVACKMWCVCVCVCVCVCADSRRGGAQDCVPAANSDGWAEAEGPCHCHGSYQQTQQH